MQRGTMFLVKIGLFCFLVQTACTHRDQLESRWQNHGSWQWRWVCVCFFKKKNTTKHFVTAHIFDCKLAGAICNVSWGSPVVFDNSGLSLMSMNDPGTLHLWKLQNKLHIFIPRSSVWLFDASQNAHLLYWTA